jgi:hypothetical protein
MRALIVIPVFDEAEAIGEVVAAARPHAPVLVVDDGSGDDSAGIAAREGAEVIRLPRRVGKGRALRAGIAAARARGASVVVTLDGDGQHDPDDVPRLLAEVSRAPRTIVVGNRLMDEHRFPAGRRNAMRVAGFFVEWVSGLRVRDTQSGFRAYPVTLFDQVNPGRGGFVFETEILVAASERGWRVREIPVSSIPQARRRSRFRPLRDGIAIGAYLASRTASRCGLEGAAAARAVASVLSRETGAMRVAECWRHPRRRRATMVGMAVALSPLLLVLAGIQAAAGRFAPDVLTPFVRRLYSSERLAALSARVEREPLFGTDLDRSRATGPASPS